MSMMETEKLLRFFHLFCTDNGNVPPAIKLTPTIVLKGNPTFYVAGDAFSWLARVKQWKISMQMEQLDREQRDHMSRIDGNLRVENKQYLGFSDAEMNSMSDIFSFFSKDITKACDEALPQSFQRLDTISEHTIFAPPLEGTTYDVKEIRKPSDHQYISDLKRLQQERKNQDNKIQQAITSFRDNRH